MSETVWDALHARERHQLKYPSEDVVRFLSLIPEPGDLLDVGCGMGRHMKLAGELGWDAIGVDTSPEALAHASQFGVADSADMTLLPYDPRRFDAVLAIGSLYYGTIQQTHAAIMEMRRVLKPGGRCLATLRTVRDWRYGMGREFETATFLLDIPGEPENGMTINFLTLPKTELLFSGFSSLGIETLETSANHRMRLNSDWLVQAIK